MGHRRTPKVGDRVRLTSKFDGDPALRGKEGVVQEVRNGNYSFPIRVRLDSRVSAMNVTASEIEVVRKNGGPFTPGIDGEVKEAERRSARLRALRKLANDLGYTLVKNAA